MHKVTKNNKNRYRISVYLSEWKAIRIHPLYPDWFQSFFFAGLIGIYYLYDYLFGPKAYNSYVLNDKVMRADIDLGAPIIIPSDKMPPLYEGGEFSISAWIYINNWSYLQRYNKCIYVLEVIVLIPYVLI